MPAPTICLPTTLPTCACVRRATSCAVVCVRLRLYATHRVPTSLTARLLTLIQARVPSSKRRRHGLRTASSANSRSPTTAHTRSATVTSDGAITTARPCSGAIQAADAALLVGHTGPKCDTATPAWAHGQCRSSSVVWRCSVRRWARRSAHRCAASGCCCCLGQSSSMTCNVPQASP